MGDESARCGTISWRRSASESQPSGRRSESTSRACGTSAPSSLARTSPVAWPTWASGASQRSMSETRISASRLRARSAPTKSSTNSSAGSISSSAGVANWARWPPSRRMAIRSPILIASSMSWVTKRIVLRISAWRRRNSFWRRSRLIGSIAPKGSSISITGGSAASARATPDPLLLAAGELRRVAVGDVGGERDQLEQLLDSRAGSGPRPSRAGRGRWRCSGRSSGAGRGRSAGSRSRSRAAAADGRPLADRGAADLDVAAR